MSRQHTHVDYLLRPPQISPVFFSPSGPPGDTDYERRLERSKKLIQLFKKKKKFFSSDEGIAKFLNQVRPQAEDLKPWIKAKKQNEKDIAAEFKYLISRKGRDPSTKNEYEHFFNEFMQKHHDDATAKEVERLTYILMILDWNDAIAANEKPDKYYPIHNYRDRIKWEWFLKLEQVMRGGDLWQKELDRIDLKKSAADAQKRQGMEYEMMILKDSLRRLIRIYGAKTVQKTVDEVLGSS